MDGVGVAQDAVEAVAPARGGGELAHQGVAGGVEVAGDLEGEGAAGGEGRRSSAGRRSRWPGTHCRAALDTIRS